MQIRREGKRRSSERKSQDILNKYFTRFKKSNLNETSALGIFKFIKGHGPLIFGTEFMKKCL